MPRVYSGVMPAAFTPRSSVEAGLRGRVELSEYWLLLRKDLSSICRFRNGRVAWYMPGRR